MVYPLFLGVLLTSVMEIQRAECLPHNRPRQQADRTEVDYNVDTFVFPSDDLPNRMPIPAPVPECKGLTFCEEASYYPKDYVSTAIQKQDGLKFLAGVDLVENIAQRIDATDDTPLCVSSEQVVYPKIAQNKGKEWLFVVNQDDFQQGVRIETCLNPDGECSVINDFAEGYKATCKQKYIYRQLACLGRNGTAISDTFRLPSSCCCFMKFSGSLLTRMGISSPNPQTPVSKSRHKK